MIRVSVVLLILPLLACEPGSADRSTTSVAHGLAEQGDTPRLLKALSDQGSVDPRDACYRTPLMLAAQFGHLDTVKELLAADARVDLHEKGYYTALMLAAGNGHTEVVRTLAAAGANIDEVEITRGWTALIWAAKRGHRDTVALLLQLGAERGHVDDRGRTARDWALAEEHPQIVALF
ncbi:MAG TPA: ankyrin repeat domain-containing protein [Gammaproteobacteria bacterium]|nr:ankyrin repeat domain-containing protein [Gammaproteobacteria bacterium]HPQ23530.1 ankyrin repeat domain-containing protein [Gammaproteobacteria bacterium]